MPATHAAWLPEELIDEFRAFERSLALRTAIEMDLFTHIGAGLDNIPALAAVCHASERGLRVLCDHLTIHRHLAKHGARYSLSLHARLYLTPVSPAYLGSAVKFLADDSTVAAFCRLRGTITRGTAPRAKPDWIKYARSMAPLTQPIAEFVAGALKLKSDAPLEVLDIAAGHGFYGLAIAAKHPTAEVFALDSRAVLRSAQANARRVGLAERYHPIPGNAFKTDFRGPYDLVLAANFAHHLDEAANIRLFRKTRAALKPSGKIVVIDFVPNADRVSPSPDASFALSCSPPARTARFTRLRSTRECSAPRVSSACGNPVSAV